MMDAEARRLNDERARAAAEEIHMAALHDGSAVRILEAYVADTVAQAVKESDTLVRNLEDSCENLQRCIDRTAEDQDRLVTQAVKEKAEEIAQLRAALTFIGRAYELADDDTAVGRKYREALRREIKTHRAVAQDGR